MKQIQIQQMDTVQACEGWFGSLNATNVHVDMEALKFIHDKKSVEEGKMSSLEQKKSKELINVYEKIADMQDGSTGTELPKFNAVSQ